ncbi:hypothetical protein B0T20DRAFT_203557 [Sordaria brevicollis]|uniref:Uncharacterized protein n=1 Tax=Sordaria brevicollis TaxID=83679 RepID=A0AAE0UBP7_SORBR|nr:hypothetical protein B0T20DRAFT_203557 [Sordaria brevicollis]
MKRPLTSNGQTSIAHHPPLRASIKDPWIDSGSATTTTTSTPRNTINTPRPYRISYIIFHQPPNCCPQCTLYAIYVPSHHSIPLCPRHYLDSATPYPGWAEWLSKLAEHHTLTCGIQCTVDAVVVCLLSTSVDTQCIQKHHLPSPASPSISFPCLELSCLSPRTRRVDATVQTSPPASLASLRHVYCNLRIPIRPSWLCGTTLQHAAGPCRTSLAERLHLLAIPRRFVSAFFSVNSISCCYLAHIRAWIMV